MRKFLTAIVLGGFIAMSLGVSYSYAGEIDILLQKLVEKGVLTAGEAQQIGTETKEQVKKEIAEGKFSSLPAWVQNTKLKGDFRVRYQYDHAKSTDTTAAKDDHRARIRLRLGLESKVNDKLLVGIGLATGLNDANTVTNKDSSRSPNQTLGEGWAKKAIGLNYAYAQYTPFSWATFLGGKFEKPLWEPFECFWDNDINPEGGALKLSKKLTSKTDGFLNTGFLVIDETTLVGGTQTNGGAHPTMFVAQPGIVQKLTDNISLKGAVSYYATSGTQYKTLDGTTSTNSTNASGLIYNYNNIVPAAELTFKDPLKALNIPLLDIPYFALFGTYVQNISVADRNTGYTYGFKLGDEKIEKWRDWQLKYNYSMIGKDAILDILPDSDRYSGKTGIRSHEVILDFGLGKNTWLSFDFYNAWQLPGNFGQTQTKPTQLFQADWNMKF